MSVFTLYRDIRNKAAESPASSSIHQISIKDAKSFYANIMAYYRYIYRWLVLLLFVCF
jgi:hypothetical protein